MLPYITYLLLNLGAGHNQKEQYSLLIKNQYAPPVFS